jgi:hypothetical protein
VAMALIALPVNTQRRPRGNLRVLQDLDHCFRNSKLCGRMTGARTAGEFDELNKLAIEYRGYRIRPTPYRTEGQYQTAGIIEKNFPVQNNTGSSALIRITTRMTRLPLPKQNIDLQGDRMFS